MRRFLIFFFTVSIPLLLFLGVWQASRYNAIEREINDYKKEQERLITENKQRISAISILSRPERIEKIAIENLDMRKAKPSEIMRIELKTAKEKKES
ncbi:cell division protein FtsL [Treponema phagedenis]|uniref:Cell division protein FtsL n=1 Tax=Treponema phagedenis TaxID=162 RepID=A0A0B7GQT5_TREPH|nr:septum formation initiator family protein [Treponema phagedenis]EFW39268.1 putative cell division protein FtsL [Treponema phagedenis F0421]NVP24563.1 cell division protein FtsL [Treponema phagedenis]QEJ94740.1 cell division protein FtsL [Treponema phagedenis]QEJ97676.1 cell division protein FtsL [Treponema phagedenis]QEK00645.1 cell division protein FtsL [Treponema phagedenis]